jgi:hypothetical protein
LPRMMSGMPLPRSKAQQAEGKVVYRKTFHDFFLLGAGSVSPGMAPI